MAKKPSRGKLLKLPTKRGKVIQLPTRKKAKSKASPTETAAKKKPAKPNRPRSTQPLPMPPPIAPAVAGGDRLSEAMEELGVAREELSRLGHALTAARRENEERKLSSGSAQSNMRAELEATRTDLKTALAELEIARADKERVALAAARRIRELEAELARARGQAHEAHAAHAPEKQAAHAPEKQAAPKADEAKTQPVERIPGDGSIVAPLPAPPKQGDLFGDDEDTH
jgi:hypothetical protein